MVTILYQDDHIVAVHKPAGMVVHRSRESRDAVTCLSATRDQVGRHVFPVHRLDRGTSGVLVFGLTSEIAAALQKKWTDGSTCKTYFALVRGWAPEEGKIDKPLLAVLDDPVSRGAVTEWKSVAQFELPIEVGAFPTTRWSLLRVRPLTGRRHQIRKHLHSISHPLLGDSIYGDGRHNRAARAFLGVHRLFLTAKSLELDHPVQPQTRLRLEADWDADFYRAFSLLGVRIPET